ncbi:MAG: MFS transporter [Candidatus Nanoarchaeia archaeon]|nr:MFS transporter [Candidatus Nanoarchaeia archaeon]MDD5238962.1 MFS transporter [Candidatus Nanoarchaeia archaeon]
MNRTIKLLIISDIFVVTGFGLISPILAIFIKDNLIGGTIFSAGLASTIFLITKSVVQLPFSRYADSHDSRKFWVIVGTLLFTTVPFIYMFTNHIYMIYIAGIINGIGSGLMYPTWIGIFSTHLDKKHEGFEWSVYSTAVGFGTAIAAAVGAAVAQFMGFQMTFLLVGIMSLVGCAILFGLENDRNKKSAIKSAHYGKMKVLHRNHS